MLARLPTARPAAARRSLRVQAADRPLWFPNATAPSYLTGKMAGDRGFDPMALGSNPAALAWYQQSELQHCRWAMLGVAGILAQELVHPEINWYTESSLPANIPGNPLIGETGKVNLGGLLAYEFILMHFVEVRRWSAMKGTSAATTDPFGNKVPNMEQGYPGGMFDPLGFSKGNMEELKTKEIKNGRLAMVAFVGFVFAAQTTGKGPLAALSAHLSDPFGNNWTHNIGKCVIPSSVNVDGLNIPLTCLWPGHL